MSTKELLLSKIEAMNEEELAELYLMISAYLQRKEPVIAEPAFLEQLARVQINGPEDFAENIDLYLNGEKQIDPSVH